MIEQSPGVEVADRPITQNINELVRVGNIPKMVLALDGDPYESADEWYVALAELHIAQLIFQHNDLVFSEDDCRNKYVSRQIFRRLAKRGHLSVFGFAQDTWSAQSAKTLHNNLCAAPIPRSFRLWGDDLRPGNILLDDADDIAAIIDREYTYTAPTQFALDPPW